MALKTNHVCELIGEFFFEINLAEKKPEKIEPKLYVNKYEIIYQI